MHVVVHAIEQVIILRAAGSVGGEGSTGLQTPGVILSNGYPRGKLGKKDGIAAVEGQLVDGSLADQLLQR